MSEEVLPLVYKNTGTDGFYFRYIYNDIMKLRNNTNTHRLPNELTKDKAVQLSNTIKSVYSDSNTAWNDFTVRGNEPQSCINIINSLESNVQNKVKDDRVKNLKRLLERALSVIKALCGQIV